MPAVSEDILAAMKRTNDIASQAIASGTIEELELVYTENARILPPGAAMVSGRTGIIEFWRAAVAGGLRRVVLTTVDVLPAGDGLVEIGRADLTMGGDNVTVKYVVFWKEENGIWKWHVDIWNDSGTDMPHAEPGHGSAKVHGDKIDRP
jgi:ketosteroid isomerase-like protein